MDNKTRRRTAITRASSSSCRRRHKLTTIFILLLLVVSSCLVVDTVNGQSSAGGGRRSCNQVLGTVSTFELRALTTSFMFPLVDDDDLEASVDTLLFPVEYSVMAVKLCHSCETTTDYFVRNAVPFTDAYTDEICIKPPEEETDEGATNTTNTTNTTARLLQELNETNTTDNATTTEQPLPVLNNNETNTTTEPQQQQASYGYADELSSLALFPVVPSSDDGEMNAPDGTSMEILPGVMLRSFVVMPASHVNVAWAPTEIFPSNMTTFVQVEGVTTNSDTFRAFTADILAGLVAAASGAISIVPDYPGYGSSRSSLNRTTFHTNSGSYRTSAITSFFAVEQYLKQQNRGCTMLNKDRLTLYGVRDGGMALPIVAQDFRGFKTRPLILFQNAAILDLETFLYNTTRSGASLTPTTDSAHLLATAAFSYSAETPGYINTGTGEILASARYRPNLTQWFAAGSESQATSGDLSAALPSAVNDIVNPNLLALFDATAEEAEGGDFVPPCQNRDLLSTIGGLNGLCEAIVNASAWPVLDYQIPVVRHNWFFDVELCFSPNDEVVSPSQYPEEILWTVDRPYITVYPGPPGFAALAPNGSHALTLQQCVIPPILYLNLVGVVPPNVSDRINYRVPLQDARRAAICQTGTAFPTVPPGTPTAAPVVVPGGGGGGGTPGGENGGGSGGTTPGGGGGSPGGSPDDSPGGAPGGGAPGDDAPGQSPGDGSGDDGSNNGSGGGDGGGDGGPGDSPGNNGNTPSDDDPDGQQPSSDSSAAVAMAAAWWTPRCRCSFLGPSCSVFYGCFARIIIVPCIIHLCLVV